MQYAGTPLLYISKYSFLDDIVKKLEEIRESAGNIFYIKNGTSETLRDGVVVVNSENVKRVSDHVPKHFKPLNNEQLGYYLAGLIDGDGHFSRARQLVLVFSSPDAFLAYYLKESLGYGNVKKVKDKNAYLLIVSNKEGMLRVINLINGKLRTEHRFNQVVNNVLSDTRYTDQNINFTMDSSKNFDNHWLAGFSDADASFQIKIIRRITRNKPEIRLNFQIALRARGALGCPYGADQKSDLLLIMIKEYLGGNIGYRKSQDTYEYNSSTFGSARKVINYFDHFHLQSRKHVDYLKWRKLYRKIVVFNTSPSENNLFKLKNSIESFSSTRKGRVTASGGSSYKLKNVREYSTNCKTFKLNSGWITGFADGDSTFMIKLKKRTNLTWQIIPVFQIGLSIRDEEIIKKIKYYFNDVGNVSYDVKNNKVYYTVNKIKDLNDYIIPHFESYTLQSDKFIDYKLWSETVRIMIAKDHLTEEGFFRVISLKTALNRGISPKLKEEFPNVTILSRAKLNYSSDSLDNNWIAGFCAAEGSFNISITNSKDRKLPQVRARFTIGLNRKDEHLLIKIKNQLGSGNVYLTKTNSVSNLEVANLEEIKENIVPFFDLYNLNNIKSSDFSDFKKVVYLIDNKEHLTELGLLQIREIKDNMNIRRK